MNNTSFQNLVNGKYGRKVLTTTVEEINRDNIVDVLKSVMGGFNENVSAIEYLWNYYHGDQPVLYRSKTIRDDVNNPVCENHAYEIVQFKVAQTTGEPISCVALKNEDAINKAVERYNDYCRSANKHARDVEADEWSVATGAGYKAVMRRKNGDIPFRIIVPSPLNTAIIYNEYTHEPVLAFQKMKNSENAVSYHCFSEYTEYIVKDDKVTLERPHVFGGIPIVEYPNNYGRISDIELVISMLDAINEIQSNRTDAIQQFVQSFFKFVNCDIDPEKFSEMKSLGAIVVNSNADGKNADVAILTQELDQEQTQTAKDDLWNNALTITAIPNKQGNTGGDTAGAVELRNGWDFAKQRAKLKDTRTIEAERNLNQIILKVIHQSKGAAECNLSVMDYDVLISHSPTDNLFTKTQALQMLLAAGIHPLVAIKTSGLWNDAEKVFMQSKPYLEAIYSTIDDLAEEEARAKEVLARADKNI